MQTFLCCWLPRALAMVLAAGFSLEVLSAQTRQASHSPGIDVAGMDRSVKPGDNFFAYANGTWLSETEIPADRSSFGAGAILGDLTDRRVAELIQAAAKGSAPAGSERRKIGEFYASFMDSTAIQVLLRAGKRIEGRGHLVLYRPGTLVQNVLRLIKADQLPGLEIVEEEP